MPSAVAFPAHVQDSIVSGVIAAYEQGDEAMCTKLDADLRAHCMHENFTATNIEWRMNQLKAKMNKAWPIQVAGFARPAAFEGAVDALVAECDAETREFARDTAEKWKTTKQFDQYNAVGKARHGVDGTAGEQAFLQELYKIPFQPPYYPQLVISAYPELQKKKHEENEVKRQREAESGKMRVSRNMLFEGLCKLAGDATKYERPDWAMYALALATYRRFNEIDPHSDRKDGHANARADWSFDDEEGSFTHAACSKQKTDWRTVDAVTAWPLLSLTTCKALVRIIWEAELPWATASKRSTPKPFNNWCTAGQSTTQLSRTMKQYGIYGCENAAVELTDATPHAAFTPHALRALSLKLINHAHDLSGIPDDARIRVLQQFANHKDVGTTLGYANIHVTDEDTPHRTDGAILKIVGGKVARVGSLAAEAARVEETRLAATATMSMEQKRAMLQAMGLDLTDAEYNKARERAEKKRESPAAEGGSAHAANKRKKSDAAPPVKKTNTVRLRAKRGGGGWRPIRS